jgi:type IV pilus biogenesis protein CpaD/CtpE
VYDKEKKELAIKESEYSNQGKYSQTTSRHIREFAAQTGVELKKVLVGTYNA